MITKTDDIHKTPTPPALPPTRVNTGGDKDEPEPKTVYPYMFMSSLGAVKLNPEKIAIFGSDEFNPQLLKCEFSINFSVFKQIKEGPFHLSYVVVNLNMLGMTPQYSAVAVQDAEGEEAKKFMLGPLSAFDSFKRSILLFEPRGYPVLEFETIIKEWRNYLGEVINQLGK